MAGIAGRGDVVAEPYREAMVRSVVEGGLRARHSDRCLSQSASIGPEAMRPSSSVVVLFALLACGACAFAVQ
jgi:hypothetical protein